MLKVFVARKVLQGGCLAPAPNDVLITFAKRMLELPQRDHQLGVKMRSASV